MNGWVIVYMPGGDIYQLFDPGGASKMPLRRRIVRNGVRTILTCVQIYWWISGNIS